MLSPLSQGYLESNSDCSEFNLKCLNIIKWKDSNLSPQEILGLSGISNEETLKQAYKKTVFKFHPDKNPTEPNASAALTIINNAFEYLSDQYFQNNDQIGSNEFYRHFNAPEQPSSEVDELEKTCCELDREISNSKRGRSAPPINRTFGEKIINQLSSHPELINKFRFRGNSILCMAAHWNAIELFIWLFSKVSDPYSNSIEEGAFTGGPLEIAIIRQHWDLINQLVDSLPEVKENLKSTIEKIFADEYSENSDMLLQFYIKHFGNQVDITKLILNDFPLMVPSLYHLNLIQKEIAYSRYKEIIIGNPEFYRKLNVEEREDRFMMIATLAQAQSNTLLVSYIPLYRLESGLLTALCELYPELKEEWMSLRIINPWPAPLLIKATFIVLPVVILLLLAIFNFWPITALNPGLLLANPILSGLVFATTIGLSFLCCSFKLIIMNALDYATKVSPEKRAIQKTLEDNNFFKPTQAETVAQSVNNNFFRPTQAETSSQAEQFTENRSPLRIATRASSN